jgi:tetratricopeptide (TPR) repeat protein
MTSDPHLIFADVSLDINRGAFQPALDKLTKMERWLPESYVLHLLFARASRGLKRYDQAAAHLGHCCRIAPANQVAWRELIEVKTLQSQAPEPEPEPKPVIDEVAEEFDQLSKALSGFTPPRATESADPTPIAEQKQPFPDDASIAVPTETLANLFINQGAYKKAIRVYTSLIQLNPSQADHFRHCIDQLLEKL